MTAAALDDFTGALNLIIAPDELEEYNTLVDRFRELVRGLSPIIEMEVMSEYDYVLEIYDGAFVSGQRVINNDFPKATTSDDFAQITVKMRNSVHRLEAVDRVLEMCFANNFIRFR